MNVTALSIARRYLGTAERPGAQHHPLITAWHEQARLGRGVADETPWCGSFVGHVAWLLDLPVPDLPARARHWLTVGEEVPLSEARPGWDIVVFRRGGGSQPGPEVLDAPGHVAFFEEEEPDRVVVIGGNQGDAVTVGRYPKSRVLGVRRLYEEAT